MTPTECGEDLLLAELGDDEGDLLSTIAILQNLLQLDRHTYEDLEYLVGSTAVAYGLESPGHDKFGRAMLWLGKRFNLKLEINRATGKFLYSWKGGTYHNMVLSGGRRDTVGCEPLMPFTEELW